MSQGALVRNPFTHGVNTQYTNVPGIGEQDNFSLASAIPPPVPSPQASTTTHNITVTVPVSAMDAKSFLDRSSDIGAAVVKELQLGSGIGSQIQSAVIGN